MQQAQSSMKRTVADTTIEKMARLTGVRLSRDHLFIESTIFSNVRLKLGMVEKEARIELVRIPSTYLFAHCVFGFTILSIGTLAFVNPEVRTVGPLVTAGIIAGGGYAVTAWFNRRAERENPLLEYNVQTQRIRIPSRKLTIGRDEMPFVLALSSIPCRANKPEKSSSELKLLFCSDDQVNSFILAGVTTGWVKDFDADILPFVEALQIPFVHADRAFHDGKFTIERVA